MLFVGKPSLKSVFVEKDHVAISLLIVKLFLIGFLLSFLINRCEVVTSLIWNGNTAGFFPDFHETIHAAYRLDPYGLKSVYPPLVYLLLYPISILVPGARDSLFSDSLDVALVYVIISVFSSIFTYHIFAKHSTIGKNQKIFLTIFIAVSAPMVFCLERGNLVIVAWSLTAAFIFLYNSEDARRRHLAILFLAVAINTKPYLGLFSLLLLFEKKYKELAILLASSAILFVVPMLIVGGIDGFALFVSNMLNLESLNSGDTLNFGFGYKIGISNTTELVATVLNHAIMISAEQVNLISSFLKVCFGIGLLLVVIYSKSKTERIIAIFMIYILITSISWIYNALYLSIPLVMVLNEEKSQKEFIISVLLILTIIPLPYGYAIVGLPGMNQVSYSTLVSSVSVIFLSLFLIYSNIICRIRNKVERADGSVMA